MADVDPAKPLKDFKAKQEFFVGIDSDGCAFDTMGIKQRECFCPWLIAYFGLQPVAQAVRECKEFADLFSKTRGANRHKTTKRIIVELLSEHPMTKARGFKVPQYPHYFAWIDDPKSLLSNDGLKKAIEKAADPEAKKELQPAIKIIDRIKNEEFNFEEKKYFNSLQNRAKNVSGVISQVLYFIKNNHDYFDQLTIYQDWQDLEYQKEKDLSNKRHDFVKTGLNWLLIGSLIREAGSVASGVLK